MRISFNEINHIKEYNLAEYMINAGVRLGTRNNGTYSFYCPFHDDEKTPSLKVNLKGDKWLYHCFGCGAGGNSLNFVMDYEKIPFLAAYKHLAGQSDKFFTKPVQTQKKQEQKPISPQAQKLLNRVIEYYHTTFYDDTKAQKYLTNERHIHEKNIYDMDIFKYKFLFVNSILIRF